MRDTLFGVPPEEMKEFTTYKSAKKGRVSFLLTKALFDNLWATSLKLYKEPNLIIKIGDYTLTGTLTKTK